MEPDSSDLFSDAGDTPLGAPLFYFVPPGSQPFPARVLQEIHPYAVLVAPQLRRGFQRSVFRSLSLIFVFTLFTHSGSLPFEIFNEKVLNLVPSAGSYV